MSFGDLGGAGRMAHQGLSQSDVAGIALSVAPRGRLEVAVVGIVAVDEQEGRGRVGLGIEPGERLRNGVVQRSPLPADGVVGKASVESEGRTEVSAADKPRRGVAIDPHHPGEGGDLIGQGEVVVDRGQLGGIAAGEQGGVGEQLLVGGGPGTGEHHRLLSEAVEVRSEAVGVAPGSQAVGPQGVDADDDDGWRGRGGIGGAGGAAQH